MSESKPCKENCKDCPNEEECRFWTFAFKHLGGKE